ncbi:MAG: purine-nucleoside phosphorylase [Candidatus Nanopelagicales bacterium]
MNSIDISINPKTDQLNRAAYESATTIASLSKVPKHDIAIVLGSGWVPAAEKIGSQLAEFSVSEVPHFSEPAVAGHAGKIRSVDINGKKVLIFLGRTHFYEGRGVDAVTHTVRTAAAAGCKTMMLTNGCGGLNPEWSPGTPVLIKDQINFTGNSPLHGAHFVDLTNLYSTRLRALCHEVEPTLPEGVYVQFPGPMYETPAEITMVRNMGGTLVGMSTALEAIVARSLGMEILGISLVTNLAAGMSGEPLNHEEVLQAGNDAAARMGDLLAKIISKI